MMYRRTKEQTLVYVMMIIPAAILFLTIVVIPIFRSVLLGFTEYNVFKPDDTKWVWFQNYSRMFADPLFWRSVKNTMFVVGVSVLLQMPLSLVLAFILYRKYVKFQGFFLAMVFLPQTISTIIIGILWRWLIINPYGFLSQLIQMMTGDPERTLDWGISQSTAMIPIGIAIIWMYTGFFVLIFVANLQKINASTIEAAEIDGATEFQIFSKIIVPSQLGTLAVNSIISIAGSLKGFDLIWAMTGGGPADYTIVLPIYMYKYAFKTFDLDAYSFGSAVATVIVVISILLILTMRYGVKAIDKKYK